MRVSVALSVVLVVGVLVGMRVSARTTEQASPSLPGQGIPRCAIPKEFGRLVTFLPGSEGIAAGTARLPTASWRDRSIECAIGTIRLVSCRPVTGGRKPPRFEFPVLPSMNTQPACKGVPSESRRPLRTRWWPATVLLRTARHRPDTAQAVTGLAPARSRLRLPAVREAPSCWSIVHIECQHA